MVGIARHHGGTMNHHGLGWAHFRKTRRNGRILTGIFVAIIALVVACIFASGYVLGDTRTNINYYGPSVQRGIVGVVLGESASATRTVGP